MAYDKGLQIYFFISYFLGGGEKWTFIFDSEMKRTKTWDKEYLDLVMVLWRWMR